MMKKMLLRLPVLRKKTVVLTVIGLPEIVSSHALKKSTKISQTAEVYV